MSMSPCLLCNPSKRMLAPPSCTQHPTWSHRSCALHVPPLCLHRVHQRVWGGCKQEAHLPLLLLLLQSLLLLLLLLLLPLPLQPAWRPGPVWLLAPSVPTAWCWWPIASSRYCAASPPQSLQAPQAAQSQAEGQQCRVLKHLLQGSLFDLFTSDSQQTRRESARGGGALVAKVPKLAQRTHDNSHPRT